MRTSAIIILLCSALTSYSQWNVGGTNINSTNTGNVGIGTTSPTYKLHVFGFENNFKARFQGADGYIDIGPANSGWAHIYTDRPAFIFNQPIYTFGSFSSYSSDLILQTTGTTRMTLTNSTGNVGIGTTTPSTKLDIQGSGGYNVDLKINGRVQTGDGTNGGGMYLGQSGSLFMGQLSSTALGFYNNGTWRLVADNNGNIGVGVTNPSTRFDVQGSGGTTVDMKINGRIQTGDNNNAGGMWVSSSGNLFMGQMSATALGLYNNGAWRLVADNNGNVGIGTTSPNQKLTVNGTIYGKEVKIDLNVPGPDYVFEKDYKLPSLDEIKSYIDANKHLPEVPSAKEMEEKGINLSEMNMILLKKVEELTLMMIQLSKANDDMRAKQDAEISKLRLEISRIKNKK